MLGRTAALVLTALGAAALHWPSIASAQQTYPSFRDVDFFYAQRPEEFRALWQAAQTGTIRIAVLGDSQETSPGSHGFQYIPLLNYEMWKRFGNSPETPVTGCFQDGASTPGNWLLASHCASPGPIATRLDSTRILPNAQPSAFSTLNAATNATGGNRGQLTLLQHDASGVHPSAGIPTDVSYFNTSGVVKARIFAATHPSSGEIAYQARPHPGASPSYSAAVTSTGTLALGLQSPTFAVKSGETGALEFNGSQYMALEVFGSSDSALTDIVGLRFVNETHPKGVVVDNFSLGGYTAAKFLSLHANAGPMFAAFSFHAAIIHYGANEGVSVSAARFKSDISGVISRVRGWAGDTNFPIILIADVYESRPPPAQMAQYDQYVGAQLSIAQADPNVMVINARRLMEDIGWNGTSGLSGQFLADGVHYTGIGAQKLSAAVVAAMMEEIRVDDCPNDPGAVTLQPRMTLAVTIGGTSACTNHGQLIVAHSLTLNQPTLDVEFASGFIPVAGDRFKLLSFDSVTGSFGSLSLPTLPSGLSWNMDDLYTTGTIGVEATPVPPTTPATPTTTPAPEPGTSTANGGSNSSHGGGGSADLLSILLLSSALLLPRRLRRVIRLYQYHSGISISGGTAANSLRAVHVAAM